jgi:hypothetical protein
MDDSNRLERFIQLKIYGNGRILNDQEAIEKGLAAEDLSRSFVRRMQASLGLCRSLRNW